MDTLYSPADIAAALNLNEDYVRNRLQMHAAANPLVCMACGGRLPLSMWGKHHGCRQGLQIQNDHLQERIRQAEHALRG